MEHVFIFFAEDPYVTTDDIDDIIAHDHLIGRSNEHKISGGLHPHTNRSIGNYYITRVRSPILDEEHTFFIYIQAQTKDLIKEFLHTMKLLHPACTTNQQLIWNTAQLLA
jgi:hypothetical protein